MRGPAVRYHSVVAIHGTSMTKRRKRLLIGAGVVTVLLAGLAYVVYFAPTSAAISHAEAFLFRRMTVTQLEGPNW